ncbi:MAG: hypothetical protein IJS59_08815 [Bacteroidaceae bacterium]|nr:hypothetical protein [Bacteroidaceae bacterium]
MNTKTLTAILMATAMALAACHNHKAALTTTAAPDTLATTADVTTATDEEILEQRRAETIATCLALYESAMPDSLRLPMTLYAMLDIDGDAIDELLLATADKRYRAMFSMAKEPKFICAETPQSKAKCYVGRIRMSQSTGHSGFTYTNYIITASRLAHTFSKTEVYGEMRESHLDGRSLTYEECLDYQEHLPRQELSTTALTWQRIP